MESAFRVINLLLALRDADMQQKMEDYRHNTLQYPRGLKGRTLTVELTGDVQILQARWCKEDDSTVNTV